MKFVFFKTSSGVKKLKLKPAPKQKEKKEDIKKGYFVHTYPFASPVSMTNAMQPNQHEPSKKIEGSGIVIPVISESGKKEIKAVDTQTINIKYAIEQGEWIKIPEVSGVKIYSQINWDRNENELIYKVIEPELTQDEKQNLEKIKSYIQEKIDVDFSQIKKKEAIDYLSKKFLEALDYFKLKGKVRDILKYYIFRDFIGLGKIDALTRDKNLEDISCDGVGIPIYVYHRDPRIGSIKTNIVFETSQELDSFVNKLAERCGKTISVSKPLLDGTLPDGSRVQATLGSDIARQGSNFTIRMFTEEPLTPTDLIEFGTLDIRLMAFLWYMIENEKSVLVSGGTATGKTSLLNVLSLFIKPQMKIVSIEDTAELRLPHPHWVPEVSRSPISEKGAVDMYELLRESLRQRPDYIIVGEVRGKEAYVLFQQMAIGHPGLSTIHSENMQKLIDRLTTAPISLPPNLLQNLDLIVFLKRIRKGNCYIRKVNEVVEVLGYDKTSNSPIMNKLFEWDSKTDTFKSVGKSFLLRKVASSLAKSEKEVQDDIKNRAKVITWMIKKGIRNYKDVGKVLNIFYANPEKMLERIGE